ncbi:MAG: cytochrome c [Bacteroidetes bacterium]|nr:MAG: cytochrome c [Bacteroidota bacterium]
MMMPRTLTLLMLGGLLLAGCRGMQSEKPPVHPNQNMDYQERFDPQEANPFFADGRAMRPPVPGTVARGFLKADTRFYFGRTETGAYVERLPVAVTKEFVLRGRERYDIYCAVCHGGAGDGRGIIMVGNGGQGYGYTPAPSYHTDRLRTIEDGYLYDVIANGIRNMPGYAQQIPVADRWAIVAYLRALQRSQNAQEGDIPPSVLVSIQQGGSVSPDAGTSGSD